MVLVEAEEEADWRSCSRSKGTKSMDLGASLIAVLLLLVVVVVAAAVVVHNSNSADVGNYTEKEENMHPDKTGNVVADVAENMSVVDVVTLLASAALQLEIALVAVAVVAVEVQVIPRRCMAIVKAVEVCHDYYLS